jgi:hypothetical protein
MFKNLISAVKSFAADGIALEIASSTALSKSQQWVLAAGALLNAKEGYVLNTVATGTHNSLLQGGLNNIWGLHNREDFLAIARRLSSLSNQTEYEAVWGEMRKFLGHYSDTSTGIMSKMVGGLTQYLGVANPIQMASAMKTLQGKTSDSDKELGVKLNNCMQWITELEGMGIEAMKVNNLMVWDASRLVNLGRWAHQLGWITEAEYFSISTPVAQQVQKTYTSWKDMLDASFVASMMWHYDENRLEGFKGAHQRLLKEPRSPLLAIPWDTRLDF